jgi:transcriptional regulator with XRE-family HTH domain
MFGEVLRAHRMRLALTQDEVADLSGVSVRNLRDLELGRIARPRRTTVDRLATALRLTAAQRRELDRLSRPGTPDALVPIALPAQAPAVSRILVGRGSELARLDALADAASNMVCITGPAGIGKSALAVLWANRAAGRFPDGQLYADLQASGDGRPTDPADVLAGFLQSLGVTRTQLPVGTEALAGAYRSLVAGRRMLVILDDAADLRQVRPLLPASSGCTAVVTSRRQLTELTVHYDAAAVRLGPLPDGAAVALLARMAGGTGVGPCDLARLAARCGNVPLAVRVVGARLAGLDRAGAAIHVELLLGPQLSGAPLPAGTV